MDEKQTAPPLDGPFPASPDAFLVEMLDRVRYIPFAMALVGVVVGFSQPRLEGWIPVAAFLIVGYVSSAWRQRQLQTSSYVLIAGLGIAVLVTELTYPGSSALVGLAGVSLIAAIIMDSLTGLICCAISAAVFLTVSLVQPLPETGPTLWSGVSILVVAMIIWATVTPMQRARTWAWENFGRLVNLTEELRDRQAELVSLHKSLDAAYYRLEQVSRELDEQRRLAEAARQAKAQFASMVSHELRTPLNLIIGFSEMMVLSPDAYAGETLPEGYRGDIEAMYRNARHLSNLVDDVLDLSQIEANRVGLEKEWVSLADIAEQAITIVSAMYQDKRLDLRTAFDDLPPIYVDGTRVREVLVNLLVNAARFTDQGGVTVRAQAAGGDVEVSVIDTGVGVAPENLPLIFQEFRHLPRVAGGENDRGFGLGLVICKRFVELHGGRIWVDSTLGGGTTFTFRLPVSLQSTPDDTDGWFRPRRALLLTEHPPVVVALSQHEAPVKVLQRYLDGYRVLHAATEDAARALIDRERPRAVVLARPDDTFDSLIQDEEIFGAIPVIRCPVRGVRDFAQQLGVVEYLLKPISTEQLTSVLRKLPGAIRNVLVVDDDPEMVRLLGRMLRSIDLDYEVRAAFSGADALSLVQVQLPDAIILDLLMPGLDGYGVVHALRKNPEYQNIPIVIVSARGMGEELTVVDQLAIQKREGLSVGEAMRCLKMLLEAFKPPAPTGSASSGAPNA